MPKKPYSLWKRRLDTGGICQYSCHKFFEIIYEAASNSRVSAEGFKYTTSAFSHRAGSLLHLSGFAV